MGKFQSSKVFDGFSTVFRQWKATTTHCRFVHGYGISFKVYFEGELDERNWVWDFGGMKRAKTKIDGKSPKEWMDYMFDHTLVVAEDDPHLNAFKNMGIIPDGYVVNHFLTDTDAFFVKTDAPRGFLHFERAPLKTSMEDDFTTGNMRFKVRERYSFGYSDPRCVYGSPGA